MTHHHHYSESGRASTKEKIMSDDEIFDVLEKCKTDLEFGTLENAVKGSVHFFMCNGFLCGRVLGDYPLKNVKVNKKIKMIRFSVCWTKQNLVFGIE